MNFPEIGYKVEIVPGESGDLFQPVITFKYKDIYEEHYDIYALQERITTLADMYPLKNISWIAVNICRIEEELKNLNLIDRYIKPNFKYIYNEEEFKDEYYFKQNTSGYLKCYHVHYDENGNIKNLEIKKILEEKLRKAIICIYKNLIPVSGKDFALKYDSKMQIALLTNHNEFDLRVKEFVFYIVDFLDMFDTLVSIYKIEHLPSDLQKFIKAVKEKINQIEAKNRN